jgi:hypothetical protein
MAVWYGLWSFGIFFPIWYIWTKKNLATMISSVELSTRPKSKSYSDAVAVTSERKTLHGLNRGLGGLYVVVLDDGGRRAGSRLQRPDTTEPGVNGMITIRVARFFLVQHGKTVKNIPKRRKKYQMAINYAKGP